MVKNQSASAGDMRDKVQSLGWEDPLEEGMAPTQYSCLGNLMDRGAWGAMVHRAAKSQTQLKQLSTHECSVQMTKHLPGIFPKSLN